MSSGIPLKVSIKLRLDRNDGRPSNNGGGFKDNSFKPKFVKRPAKKKVVRLHPPEHLLSRKEPRKTHLDLFEENNNVFKVIGEFPGVKSNDIIIQVEANEIYAVSRPTEAERIYFGSCALPKASALSIKEKRTQNGFMILTLEKKVKKNKRSNVRRKKKTNKIKEASHDRNAG